MALSEMDTSTPPLSSRSAIALLPAEVLAYTLDIAHDKLDHDVDIPTVASLVSRSWQEVVLNDAFLWSFITVAPPWNISAVRTQLARSREHLLELRIVVRKERQPLQSETWTAPSMQDTQELRKVLSPHYARCWSLTIEGAFSGCRSVLSHLLELFTHLSMPHLTHFTFYDQSNTRRMYEDSDDEDMDPPPIDPMPLFSVETTGLLDLRLSGSSAFRYSPPLAAVTNLHIGSPFPVIDFRRFAKILESCPYLVFLALYDHFLNAWPTSSFAGTTLEVPLLESLFILGDMYLTSQILSSLSAPKLEELIIAPVVPKDLKRLHNTITSTTSGPRFPLLWSLTLAVSDSSTAEIFSLASACFPQVTRLVLADVYKVGFEDAFRRAGVTLFPTLTELALTRVKPDFLATLDSVRKPYLQAGIPWVQRVYFDTVSFERIKSGLKSDWQVEALQGNLWDNQRRRAMYNDDEYRFVG